MAAPRGGPSWRGRRTLFVSFSGTASGVFPARVQIRGYSGFVSALAPSMSDVRLASRVAMSSLGYMPPMWYSDTAMSFVISDVSSCGFRT